VDSFSTHNSLYVSRELRLRLAAGVTVRVEFLCQHCAQVRKVVVLVREKARMQLVRDRQRFMILIGRDEHDRHSVKSIAQCENAQQLLSARCKQNTQRLFVTRFSQSKRQALKRSVRFNLLNRGDRADKSFKSPRIIIIFIRCIEKNFQIVPLTEDETLWYHL